MLQRKQKVPREAKGVKNAAVCVGSFIVWCGWNVECGGCGGMWAGARPRRPWSASEESGRALF